MAVHSRFLVCHLSSYAEQYQFQLADNLLWESVLSFHLATHMLWRNFIAQQAIHHGLVSCPLALEGSLSCSSAWLQWPKYSLTGPSRACMMKRNYQNKDEDCHLLSPWTVPWQPSLQAHVLVLDFFFLLFLFYFILFYNHTWHSLTIQLHGTYLQQDYKIYLRYSFTTYLFATYLH